MKATTIEKRAIQETRGNGARRASTEKRRDAQVSLKAAGDTQLAEIERTFTIRYEW